MVMIYCEECEEYYAFWLAERCIDCSNGYCQEHADFEYCINCGEPVCDECKKKWRGVYYCEDCYNFPHDQ